jgi:heme/copper-type cytochrome/quinol oxidase subunit 2
MLSGPGPQPCPLPEMAMSSGDAVIITLILCVFVALIAGMVLQAVIEYRRAGGQHSQAPK